VGVGVGEVAERCRRRWRRSRRGPVSARWRREHAADGLLLLPPILLGCIVTGGRPWRLLLLLVLRVGHAVVHAAPPRLTAADGVAEGIRCPGVTTLWTLREAVGSLHHRGAESSVECSGSGSGIYPCLQLVLILMGPP